MPNTTKKKQTHEYSNIIVRKQSRDLSKSSLKDKDESDPPKNYRLITLEKKFTHEQIKAKDQIEAISKKLEILQSNNISQKDQMRNLDNEKRESFSTVSYL